MTAPQALARPKPSAAGRARTVAILESSAKMGGIQHTTLALAAGLEGNTWKPIVICPEEGELTLACRSADVEVRTLPVYSMRSTSVSGREPELKLPNPFAWMWNAADSLSPAPTALPRFLKQASAGSGGYEGSAVSLFYGGLAARKAGIPCLWYVQDRVSERFLGIYKSVFGVMAAAVPTRIAAIGPEIIRQLPRGLQSRARVVYNAVDSAKFRPGIHGDRVRRELGIPPGAFVVGNAARLTPWKGQHHLINAFAQVTAQVPDAYLLLIGGSLFGDGDYEARLRRQVAALNLRERVIFAGHRQDMNAALSAMDVFAYAAVEKDICPLSLLEAMSTGLPIAAFDIEGVCEAATGEREALLVRTGDSAALAQALLRLSRDPDLRSRLGVAARERVQRQFSLDQYVLAMERTFDEVLAP